MQFLSKCTLNNGRAGSKDLACILHHDAPVRQHGTACRTTGHGTHHCTDDRYHPHELRGTLKAILTVARNDGIAFSLDCVHRSTRAIDEIDQGDAVFISQVFNEAALTALAAITAKARARTDGVVLAADCYRPIIDFPKPHHIRSGLKRHQLVPVVHGFTGQLSHFTKGSRIHQFVNAFAHCQFTVVVLALDSVLSPAVFSQGVAMFDVFNFF